VGEPSYDCAPPRPPPLGLRKLSRGRQQIESCLADVVFGDNCSGVGVAPRRSASMTSRLVVRRPGRLDWPGRAPPAPKLAALARGLHCLVGRDGSLRPPREYRAGLAQKAVVLAARLGHPKLRAPGIALGAGRLPPVES